MSEKYKNIFYFKNINSIGGVESFFYYMIRKYEDYDITIFYKTADLKQLMRLRKYARCVQFNGQEIVCEKAFFSYGAGIIDYVKANEYIQIVHTDYSQSRTSIKLNPKIDRYIGVSQTVCNNFKKLTGIDCELCYNPLFIDKPRKILNLISATRLTPEKRKG